MLRKEGLYYKSFELCMCLLEGRCRHFHVSSYGMHDDVMPWNTRPPPIYSYIFYVQWRRNLNLTRRIAPTSMNGWMD